MFHAQVVRRLLTADYAPDRDCNAIDIWSKSLSKLDTDSGQHVVLVNQSASFMMKYQIAVLTCEVFAKLLFKFHCSLKCFPSLVFWRPLVPLPINMEKHHSELTFCQTDQDPNYHLYSFISWWQTREGNILVVKIVRWPHEIPMAIPHRERLWISMTGKIPCYNMACC